MVAAQGTAPAVSGRWHLHPLAPPTPFRSPPRPATHGWPFSCALPPAIAPLMRPPSPRPMQDFTFVCPTEIIAFSDRAKEFEAAGAQLIAASTDTEECHLAWIK
jgi:hypothetical protein